MRSLRAEIKALFPPIFPGVEYRGSRSVPIFIMLILSLEVIMGLGVLVNQVYVFALLFMLGLTLAIFMKPDYQAPLMILSLPFTSASLTLKNEFRLLDVIIVLCFIYLLIEKKDKKIFAIKGNKLFYPLFLFVLWVFISIAWSPIKSSAIKYTLVTSLCFMGFIVIYQKTQEEKSLYYLLWSWFFMGVLDSLLVISGMVINPGERQRGLSWASSEAGIDMLLSLLLSLGLFMASSYSWKKVCIFAGFPLMTVAILATGARNVYVSFAFSLILVSSFVLFKELFKKDIKKFGIILIAVLLFLLIIGYSLISLTIQSGKKDLRFNILTQIASIKELGKNEALRWRIALWELGFEQFVNDKAYLWGWGTNGWPAKIKGKMVQTLYGQLDEKGITMRSHPHSLYLGILFNLGIIGLIIFLWTLGYFLSGIWRILVQEHPIRQRRLLWAYFTGLIGYLLCSFIEHQYFDRRIWLYLGLGVAIINLFSYKEYIDDI